MLTLTSFSEAQQWQGCSAPIGYTERGRGRSRSFTGELLNQLLILEYLFIQRCMRTSLDCRKWQPLKHDVTPDVMDTLVLAIAVRL